MTLNRGFVQIYTGKGKGKTTAALGLALRGAGAGLKVYIGQFLKSGRYSENISIHSLAKNIVMEAYGNDRFICGEPCTEEIRLAEEGLKKAGAALLSGEYDIVILDEINVALALGLIREEDVAEMIRMRPKTAELVLTGRNAPASIMDLADLITEMKEIKHYFSCGVEAREGIEK
ncbi:cob(I)yrinic acid a,c-diamide adenosyltransferase [Geovibrio thiophilus]|uniref:corrinoid adenosyltransferase n=1 Tax=Geovibrio thiophilus TaxID=139438 RepID=A0A410K1T1_9BACT|nr:cob(I)yrinic acid a,c-diamide adenosyltransferase [Geovibrio thiophilus]QAR34386.1 cob(I)yrinic acid a,c-diamide adenosyltransferase [Geovibrio thiophilus]